MTEDERKLQQRRLHAENIIRKWGMAQLDAVDKLIAKTNYTSALGLLTFRVSIGGRYVNREGDVIDPRVADSVADSVAEFHGRDGLIEAYDMVDLIWARGRKLGVDVKAIVERCPEVTLRGKFSEWDGGRP